jgi:hypothetical protein
MEGHCADGFYNPITYFGSLLGRGGTLVGERSKITQKLARVGWIGTGEENVSSQIL